MPNEETLGGVYVACCAAVDNGAATRHNAGCPLATTWEELDEQVKALQIRVNMQREELTAAYEKLHERTEYAHHLSMLCSRQQKHIETLERTLP